MEDYSLVPLGSAGDARLKYGGLHVTHSQCLLPSYSAIYTLPIELIETQLNRRSKSLFGRQF